MAIIKRGILGGFSNKIGNIVGSSWKGIAVMKSLPLSVANPRTAAQVNQRNKFAAVVAIASTMLSEIVKPLWDRFAVQQSGYNAFIQANISAFNDNGDLTNQNDFFISQGKLENIVLTSVIADVSNSEVIVTFPNNAGQGFALASDDGYYAIINKTQNELIAFAQYGSRDSGGGTFQTAPFLITDQIYVYYAMARQDGTMVSTSIVQLATNQA